MESERERGNQRKVSCVVTKQPPVIEERMIGQVARIERVAIRPSVVVVCL